MSELQETERRVLGMPGPDWAAVLWAVACCWLGVWGNYILLSFGLEEVFLVPFDLFAVPLIVTAAFWLAGRGRKRAAQS